MLPGSEILLATSVPHQASYFGSMEQQRSKGQVQVDEREIQREEESSRTISLPPVMEANQGLQRYLPP